jgi:hypothetical protein
LTLTAITLICSFGCKAHREQSPKPGTFLLGTNFYELRPLDQSVPVDLSHAELVECSDKEAIGIARCLGRIVGAPIEVQRVAVAWFSEPLAARVFVRVSLWDYEFYLGKETNGEWRIASYNGRILERKGEFDRGTEQSRPTPGGKQ